MLSSFMQMPGVRIMPGCDTFYLVGPRKPGVMGRVAAVGDSVTWDSAAGGLWSRKQGEVVEVVPAGCRPQHMRSTLVRDHESYVVRCDGGQVWWPNASAVRLR